ncbi:MAG TPA: type II toxin-antitoxin system VapC family toxin [Candidatus Binatia bacterium]|jgi:predicted nucleic acid-binding protein
MIIDTTILVDLLRGSTKARTFLGRVPPAERMVSAVTVAELVEGCRSRREVAVLDRELHLYKIVWIDEPQSQLADRWHRRFRLSKGIGYLDCLIGAAAFCSSATLATLNEKHFRILPGMSVSRPY